MTLDIIGNIAIFKFPEKIKKNRKLKEARKLLKENSNIKTVLEKSDKVRGRLRTLKTKFLAGQDTREALYAENSCKFRLNIETCYFSSRLAEERKQIAKQIKKSDKVLVLFSGVAPFPIVIAKLSGCKKIIAIELSKECNKYARENLKLNKLEREIQLIQGDVKKKVTSKLGKFNIIIMPRPNLRESFLKQAFQVSKKSTKIFDYCFGRDKDLAKNLAEIYNQAKKSRKKIKILKIKKTGEIAPYKFRWRIDFILKN